MLYPFTYHVPHTAALPPRKRSTSDTEKKKKHGPSKLESPNNRLRAPEMGIGLGSFCLRAASGAKTRSERLAVLAGLMRGAYCAYCAYCLLAAAHVMRFCDECSTFDSSSAEYKERGLCPLGASRDYVSSGRTYVTRQASTASLRIRISIIYYIFVQRAGV